MSSRKAKSVSTAEPRPGVVSVVLVNFRGTDDTLTCVRELGLLSYPQNQLEIIVVENDSGDDSAARLRVELPSSVKLVVSPRNGGFTGGCNLGVTAATGEFLAFINNDARPDRHWLTEAVKVLRDDSTIGCVASKVLDWDGINVDFVDAAATWFGMGYKPTAGSPYDGKYESQADVLFPTGSAMVMRTDLFREVGGFDERYFMFYEDVDLGWRLNLLGHRVRYVPTSLVYHKHHATMNKFGSYREWFLLERNALMTLYKNVEDETLEKLLAPAMALAVRRSLAIGEADTTLLDLEVTKGGDADENTTVSKRSLTGSYAIDSFLDRLPSLAQTREDLQDRRRRSDRELTPLLRNPIEPAIPNERYLAGHAALIEAFDIAKVFRSSSRIVVVTGDPLTNKMSGPGIRALHIAEELAIEHEVKLVSTTACALEHERFQCLMTDPAKLRPLVQWADIVVFQGFLLHQAPWIADTKKIIVVDIYDPIHLEQLEQGKSEQAKVRERNVASTTQVLNDQLSRGDFFICASEEQRHFWLGQLAGMGRLNPKNYDRDSSLRSLLDVCPFGMPPVSPERTGPGIRGAVPGISDDDKVIIWAGGVYNWFDPLTLIRAVAQLSQAHNDIRLFFLGMKHPNPGVPEMQMAWDARALSDALGLTGKHVFFNETWVAYDERQNYLLDADLGVSTHFEHAETTFAFRTRILDYLWAGLPIVATEGDSFGRLIRSEGLGVAVPEQDVDALAAAIEKVLYDAEAAATFRANVARVRQTFFWSRALAPLIDFCRNPRRAADTDSELTLRRQSAGVGGGVLARNLEYARVRMQEGGLSLVLRRGLAKAARLLRERREQGA